MSEFFSISVSWEPPPSLGDQHTRETFYFLASAVSSFVSPSPRLFGNIGRRVNPWPCAHQGHILLALYTFSSLSPTLKLSEMCTISASRGCRPLSSGDRCERLCKQLQAVGISVQSLAKAGSRGMASLCSCLETLFRELVKEVPQPLPQKWVLPPWE